MSPWTYETMLNLLRKMNISVSDKKRRKKMRKKPLGCGWQPEGGKGLCSLAFY